MDNATLPSKIKSSCFFAFLLFMSSTLPYAQSEKKIREYRNEIKSNNQDNRKKVESLINLSSAMLFKAGELKKDLDSANLVNNQAYRVSKKLKYNKGIGQSLLLQGQIERERGKEQLSLKRILAAATFFSKNGFAENEADCYLYIAKSYWSPEQGFNQKINYCEKAIRCYQKTKSTIKQATAMEYLGELYFEKEDLSKAEQFLLKAQQYYKAQHYSGTPTLYNSLAKLYYKKGNSKEALKFSLWAEKTALRYGANDLELITIYNQLGLNYFNLKNYNEAEKCFKKGLEIAYRVKSPNDIRTITLNISSVHMAVNQNQKGLELISKMNQEYPSNSYYDKAQTLYLLVSGYVELNDLKNAKKYYDEVLLINEKSNDDDARKTYILPAIVYYLQASKQYRKTYQYLKLQKALAEKSGDIVSLANVETFCYINELNQKNYKQALEHLNNYRILNDSMFNVERNKQISELQVQHETEKKDQDIKILQNQAALNKSQMEKNKVVRYVFVGSLIVLAVFLFLLYHRYRFKQKSNEELKKVQNEVNAQNELLKNLLTEKEWLLKEIHHRVKNNLQIVISLLNTQSAYLDNEDALLAIQNSQHRMHAMSLIHQKLYQSENLSTIDFSWYIKELVEYLKYSFDSESKITFTLELLPLELDVSEAVPLGLILNEAINNAIKYAFKNSDKGQITVTLEKCSQDDKVYQLTIADNGVGIPENFDSETTTSLGISLMKGLTKQLDGEFTLGNDNGLKVGILFKRQQRLP